MRPVICSASAPVLCFARATLRITVAVGGAVFWGWDGAGPLPSEALSGAPPRPDARAVLEPDTGGGWRVVSERVTVAVSQLGAVEIRTPGGVLLRRDLPPCWWEPVGGGGGRWLQSTELPADARVFGLPGPGPRAGAPAPVTAPLLLVVADAASHFVFHDTARDGTLSVRDGEEGAGSGHDRPGRCELRMAGGPLRCWVAVGTPTRVLRTWTALRGAQPLPPDWAFGHHHVRYDDDRGEESPRRAVERHRELRLPLDAVHMAGERGGEGGELAGLTPDGSQLPRIAVELAEAGVWLVSSEAAGGQSGQQGLPGGVLAQHGPPLPQTSEVAPVGDWAGLREALGRVLGLGLSGVPYAGVELELGRLEGELLLRALQLGIHLPLLRTGGEWTGRAAEAARPLLAERQRLLPYRTTLARTARRGGVPMVRPVWWQTPADRRLRAHEDTFLLGDALLVAPVLAAGVRELEVRLPRGRWYDTASGRLYRGPRTVRLAAPPERIPVLVRAGAVLPVREEDGSVGLEVWAPPEGRTGSGVYVPQQGADRAAAERYTARRGPGGLVAVEREGTGGPVPAARPVRIHGDQAPRDGTPEGSGPQM
ncbi:glycosyl hydrolase [Streptomyces sp. NPDC058045]|uniref:glycosyl hydrolase n=1 Tax=Streptomyces sp. NPDC058045 TaxID=3346311 RepID=UPI0036F15033